MPAVNKNKRDKIVEEARKELKYYIKYTGLPGGPESSWKNYLHEIYLASIILNVPKERCTREEYFQLVDELKAEIDKEISKDDGMKYIIRITDEDQKIRYYRGMKENPYLKYGHLADWTLEEKEAKVYNNRDKALANAVSINEIAIVKITEVIEIDENFKNKIICTLTESEQKKEVIKKIDSFIEKRKALKNKDL